MQLNRYVIPTYIFAYAFLLLELMALAVLTIGMTFAYSDAFVSGNQTAKFYFFVKGIAVIVLIRCIRLISLPKKSVIRITWLDGIIIAFFLYISINRFVIGGISAFTMHYYELIGLAILYLIIRTLKKESYTILFIIVILAGLFQAVYGNLQLYGMYPSHHNLFYITGGFFNPGPYAGFLISVLPVAVAFYLFSGLSPQNVIQGDDRVLLKTVTTGRAFNSRIFTFLSPRFTSFFLFKTFTDSNLQTAFTKHLALIAMIAIIIVLPATESRAAWLAAIVSAIWLLAFRYDLQIIYQQFFPSLIKKTLLVILLATLTIGVLGGMYLFKKDSADGRLLIWKATVDMIYDKPVLGHGYEKFPAHYMNYQAGYFNRYPDSDLSTVAGDVNYGFNELLKLTSETGLVGFALLFTGLITLFLPSGTRIPDRKSKTWLYAGRAGIISILVFGLFSYPGSILPIKLNLVLYLAVIAPLSRPLALWGKTDFFVQPFVRIFLASSIMAVGYFVILPHMKNLHRAHLDWKDGHRMYSLSAYENSLKSYMAAFPLLKEDGDFLVYYGKALSMGEEHEEAVYILNRAKNYRNNIVLFTTLGDSYKAIGYYGVAEQAYQHAYQMSNRFYPLYLLAKLYDTSGQKELAIKSAQELINKEVKISSTAIDEMMIEMQGILKRNQSNTLK